MAIANRMERQFNVAALSKVWVGDIPYVWTDRRLACLAVILDLFSRWSAAWALSLTADSEPAKIDDGLRSKRRIDGYAVSR